MRLAKGRLSSSRCGSPAECPYSRYNLRSYPIYMSYYHRLKLFQYIRPFGKQALRQILAWGMFMESALEIEPCGSQGQKLMGRGRSHTAVKFEHSPGRPCREL